MREGKCRREMKDGLRPIQNPWLKLLPSDGSYILEEDRESVSKFNQVAGTRKKINVESVPEPFIGNPKSATVVLLSLNPGDADADWESHHDGEFRKAMFNNLHQKSQEYPFYPLNPAFAWTGAGKWWRPRTHELQLESGLDYATLAKKLLVIEWFPYHSKKSGLGKTPICESQKYSFQLAKEMLDTRLVVLMRARKQWLKVDQRSGRNSLRNPQCGYITRGNTEGDLFDRIVRALRTRRTRPR